MHYSARFQELAVTLQEHRAHKPAVLALHLRVRECKPDFRHLARGEECLHELDSGTEECGIDNIALGCLLRSLPHPGTLDIDSDIVHSGIAQGQVNRVFTLSAAKFQDYGAIPSAEHPLIPPPLHRMVLQHQWRMRECSPRLLPGQNL